MPHPQWVLTLKPHAKHGQLGMAIIAKGAELLIEGPLVDTGCKVKVKQSAAPV